MPDVRAVDQIKLAHFSIGAHQRQACLGWLATTVRLHSGSPLVGWLCAQADHTNALADRREANHMQACVDWPERDVTRLGVGLAYASHGLMTLMPAA